MKLDERSAAERMGIRGKTLANWRSLGGGPPFYKVGGRIVYDHAEIDAWLATKRRVSTSDPGPSTDPSPGKAKPPSAGAARRLRRRHYRLSTARHADARLAVTGPGE